MKRKWDLSLLLSRLIAGGVAAAMLISGADAFSGYEKISYAAWDGYRDTYNSTSVSLLDFNNFGSVLKTGTIPTEKYSQNGSRLDGELIFEALDEGCETANKVFDEYIDWVAVGIKSLINIFGPDAIILAGGITQQGDRLIRPLRERVNTDVVLEISRLQNDAGALGAAML